MITTNRTPCTTRHRQQYDQVLKEILDADGVVIGSFFDWRNADACAAQSSLDPDLPRQLSEAEDEMEQLEKDLDAEKRISEKLRAKLEKKK